MAESTNNQMLSAVTEGQGRSSSQRQTRSSRNADLSPVASSSKSVGYSNKKASARNSNSSRKRSLNTETDHTEEDKSSKEKRKRAESVDISQAQSPHIANRTRSRTSVLSSDLKPSLNSTIGNDSSEEDSSSSSSESALHKTKKVQSRKQKAFSKNRTKQAIKAQQQKQSSTCRSLRSSINSLEPREAESKTHPGELSRRNQRTISDPRRSPENTGSEKALNLGARLARGSSGREPQVGTSVDTQGQPPSLLRRSSRTKGLANTATTGTCQSLGGAQSNSTLNIVTNQRSAHRSHSNKSVSSATSTAKNNASQSPISAQAGPSTSSNPIEFQFTSDMSDKVRHNSDNQGNSGGESNAFIKLHKLSMPLIDNGNSSQQQTQPPELIQNNMGEGAAGGVSSFPSNSRQTQPQLDSESDDSEVGRLQALLEARGLPPQLFGALGPRMHHLLHRTMGVTSSSKAQTLLQGLQSSDESQQLQAAIEMCQMLVMGNEDTLAGFPIKQVVPALIILLRMEHNFDLMMNACRALAYMLEALPRSSATVVDAIPAFLEKLQVIQWVDVAEQSLTALEILSRRHNKCILHANGVSACLTYLDFFSINAQRSALAITANCCQNLHSEEFHHVKDSLALLARLLEQHDKKSVESICTAFYRLVDSFQHDPVYLQEIASMELLKNCQQLLVVTPPVLNSGTFTNVVRMLSVMCANCPDIAITLLKNDIAATLLYLLTGTTETMSSEIELISRSPSEVYEITCLIGELMPRLPTDGIFSVDILLERTNMGLQDAVQWQWKDDRGIWRAYNPIDSRMIEAAHSNSDDEISLTALGRTYTIDFNSMQQINEDSGTTRAVQRKVNNTNVLNVVEVGKSFASDAGFSNPTIINLTNRPPSTARDARIACLKEERGLAANFIKVLFSVLYEVYSSSAGPSVRYKCLKALLRMVYYANRELLQEVLKHQLVSAHIAGMMASSDVRIVVGALQMAEILMQKLPDVFSVHFRREGVMHQINLLADPNIPICAASSPKGSADAVTGTTPPSAPASVGAVFNFDQAIASTSKNLSFSKTPMSVPSTSGSSANNCSINITKTSHIFHKGLPPQPFTGTPLLAQQVDMIPNVLHAAGSSNSDMVQANSSGTKVESQSKVSDIIKRKNPPKRKSQGGSKPKSRNEEGSTAPHFSFMMQEQGTSGAQSSNRNASGSSNNSGSSSKSRFTNASSKTTSFLQSLNPVRWRRTGSQSSSSSLYSKPDTASSALTKSVSNSNLIAAGNREKARQWVREHAISFIQKYADNDGSGTHPVVSILLRLKSAIQKLEGDFNDCIWSLHELKNILIESDISPFEVNHSGLIKALVYFLTNDSGHTVERDRRLRAFMHVFVGLPASANCSQQSMGALTIDSSSFSALVSKLNGCVTQLEQFPVKVHDFPSGFGGRSNTSALKFFNTHQLKCNLQRHPECNNLRQWKGGTVKIDPLALVQAIERYLVVRGYGGIRIDSEEDSEDDIDNIDAAAMITQGGAKHKLQFLIGDNVLPYNMTVYQAVRQFSPLVNDQSETDTDTETPLGNASIWVQQHTIYYRPVEEENSNCSYKNIFQSSSSMSSSSASSSATTSCLSKKLSKSSKLQQKRKPELWNDGVIPTPQSQLAKFLVPNLPTFVTIQDASLEVILLLRIINALNRHWNCLYDAVSHSLIISQNEFIHPKIAAKASRQLQDPLVIMTGNLPQWLHQLATVCPFLFPFETRQLLFYAISFDRDRALQRLLDLTPDLNASDSSERVTPRLDRRKRPISREDILKQAETIMQDFGHSKALLEIQYENEVGTGLGPTLEFYALVSTELQRCDLDLWNDNDSYKNQPTNMVLVEQGDIVKANEPNVINDCQDEKKKKKRHFSSTAYNQVSLTISNETNQINDLNLHVENSTLVGQHGSVDVLIEQSDTIVVHSQDHVSKAKEDRRIAYVNAPMGLFPSPVSKNAKTSQISRLKTKFKFLGKFMAKAVMDSRMLDLPFSIPFYRWLLGEEFTLNLTDLLQVSPEVQATLIRLNEIVKQRDMIQSDMHIDAIEKAEKIESLDLDGCPIADLGLDFVLPGHSSVELKRGGKDTAVTIHNLHQYITLVTHWSLFEGVTKQFEALKEGFDSVFPLQRLQMFYPEELENVFCGSGMNSYLKWDQKMLSECCRTDHGFTQDSKAILFFYDILSSYTKEEQRLFLQFVTGSPRLPTGGLKALSPPLTIVRKKMDLSQNPDDYLPSVMTCVNYLKLPDYTSREIMREKLHVAASEGSMCFHLS